MSRPQKLLEQVRDVLRVKHYSYGTEQTYVYSIRCFILFHNKGHPSAMGTVEVTQFLTYLTMSEQIAAATQNQAFSAIVFLYRFVLQQELVGVDAIRAKPSRYLPTILTLDKAQAVIGQLHGVHKLLMRLLYSSELRLSKGLSLGIKIDRMPTLEEIPLQTLDYRSCHYPLPNPQYQANDSLQ